MRLINQQRRFQARLRRLGRVLGLQQAPRQAWQTGPGLRHQARQEAPPQARQEVPQRARQGRGGLRRQVPYDLAELSTSGDDAKRRAGRPTRRPAAGRQVEKPRAPGQALPIENYDELTVDDVSSRLEGLSSDELKRIRDYEQRHKNRRTLLEVLDARLEGGA